MIKLMVGGRPAPESLEPVLAEGGFIVPIALIEELGGDWSVAGDRVTVRANGREAELTLGAPTARLNSGGTQSLTAAPFRVDDVIYVPLTFLADFARYRVNWDVTGRVLALERWTSLTSLVSPGAQRITSSPAAQSTQSAQAARESNASAASASALGAQAAVATEPAVARLVPPVARLIPGEGVTTAGVGAGLQPVGATMQPVGAALQPVGAVLQSPLEVIPAPFGVHPVPPLLAEEAWPELAPGSGIRYAHVSHAGLERFVFRSESELKVETSALIQDPYRLVVDARGIGSRVEGNVQTVQGSIVRQVRARTEPESVLRIVFDLEVGVGHQIVQVSPNEFAVVLFRPLRTVTLEPTALGGRIQFDISGETPYKITQLREPDRLVIDLQSTTLVGGPIQLESPVGPVKGVRAAQFAPDTTRVVLDLREAVPVFAEQTTELLSFRFGDPGTLIGYRVASPTTLQVGLLIEEGGDVSVSYLTNPDRVAIDVRGVKLDQTPEPVFLLDGPVYRLRASQFDEGTVRIVADLKYYVQHAITREGGRTVVTLSQPLLAGRKIALDAGHGGHDPGAMAEGFPLTEKDVNLDIARRLASLLGGAGADLLMTREDDTAVSLWTRSDVANEYQSEVFVSIHHNSSRSESETASGTETYVQQGNEDSVRLGALVHSSIVSALGTKDRGVRPHPGYIVLNRSQMPSILVEVGFISHPEDRELIAQDWFRQRAAEGIFNGLLRYFHPKRGMDPPEVEGRTAQVGGQWQAFGPAAW